MWLLALAAAALAGCGGNNEGANNYLPMNRKNVTPEAVERAAKNLASGKGGKVATGTSDFGFKLLNQMVGKAPSHNLFISPASVSMALAMTYNGAGGGTKDAFETVLGFKGFLPTEVNTSYKELRTLLLAPDPKVTINIANGIWADEGAQFKREFLGRNADFFGAKISPIDLQSPQAPETINAWVKEETENKIPKLFDAISNDARMILVNAVYFKGPWLEPFKPAATADHEFTTFDGKKATVKMMRRSGELEYVKTERFAAVRLPYGDGKIAMTVILPEPASNLTALLKDVNAKHWGEWQSKFQTRRGELGLPKFTFETSASLNEPLTALGLGAAFDEKKADFSGMTEKEKLFISRVLHKTFVDVNEEGTEAAAATGVEMETTAMPNPDQTVRFIADRPFFFAISEKSSGLILFMGIYGKP